MFYNQQTLNISDTKERVRSSPARHPIIYRKSAQRASRAPSTPTKCSYLLLSKPCYLSDRVPSDLSSVWSFIYWRTLLGVVWGKQCRHTRLCEQLFSCFCGRSYSYLSCQMPKRDFLEHLTRRRAAIKLIHFQRYFLLPILETTASSLYKAYVFRQVEPRQSRLVQSGNMSHKGF